MPIRRTGLALLASGAVGATLSGPAVAASGPESFGLHVAACAQTHLGQRDAPPSVTCVHDGMTMTFANFGQLVDHVRSMHA